MNLSDSEIEIGQHFWALLRGELLVLMKTRLGYELCGDWECGIDFDEFEIISLIDKPKGHEQTKLYYV